MTLPFTSRRAFTLIELLVVITIIAILAGITLGVTGNVRYQAAKSRAQVEIAAIETALERYKIDNGDYPEAIQAATLGTSDTFFPTSAGDPRTTAYKDAGKALFLALAGRAKYADTLTAGQVQYIELKESQTELSGTASYIIDPFGYPYGYYYNPLGIGGTSTAPTSKKSLFNFAVPDIWSTAGETKTISESVGTEDNARYLRWVTNWNNK